MPYNSLISSTDADALIPTEVSSEIIKALPAESAVMKLARRLPNMASSQKSLPVVSALPTAYFVNGETGLKQTSEVNWTDKTIYAEELAVIVPVPESVIDDSDYPIWDEVQPLILEAFGKAFDAAVLIGTNAPSNWPDDLLTGAGSASHTVTYGTGADLYEDMMDDGGVLSLVEADGFMVNGHVAVPGLRGLLRGLRSADGVPLFNTSMQESSRYILDGDPIEFIRNASFTSSSAYVFSGDWSQLVYAIRQDMTFKIATEGVIQDASGNIVYNLFQQDMVGLRAVMRLGWQLPNPITRDQETEASRYPFAVLVP